MLSKSPSALLDAATRVVAFVAIIGRPPITFTSRPTKNKCHVEKIVYWPHFSNLEYTFIGIWPRNHQPSYCTTIGFWRRRKPSTEQRGLRSVRKKRQKRTFKLEGPTGFRTIRKLLTIKKSCQNFSY